MTKPQIIGTYVSSEFHRRLWNQEPLIDFYQIQDYNCSSASAPFWGIEPYEQPNATEQAYLFYYPLIEWLHYPYGEFEYQGRVATSLPYEGLNLVYVPRLIIEATNAEYKHFQEQLALTGEFIKTKKLIGGNINDRSLAIAKNITLPTQTSNTGTLFPGPIFNYKRVGENIIEFLLDNNLLTIQKIRTNTYNLLKGSTPVAEVIVEG